VVVAVVVVVVVVGGGGIVLVGSDGDRDPCDCVKFSSRLKNSLSPARKSLSTFELPSIFAHLLTIVTTAAGIYLISFRAILSRC
jgi:hypothetical protein